MRRVRVIGVGAGDPSQITVEAVRALNACDVLFELDRGARDLTRAREEIVRRYVEAEPAPRVVAVHEPRRDRSEQSAAAYAAAVEAWRAARAEAWEEALAEVGEEQTGGFLVWGDPSLYDSTIAVLDEILARGRVAFSYDVIPGISSVHALTARHRISLNRVGAAVQITTGRRLADHGWPAGVADVVVMLDGQCSFRHLIDEPLDIYWGAYLGTPDEILISGPLADVADRDRARPRRRARAQGLGDGQLSAPLPRMRVEVAVAKALGGERGPDEDRRRALDAGVPYLVGDRRPAIRVGRARPAGWPGRRRPPGSRGRRTPSSVCAIEAIACAPRWITSVAPCAASDESSSPAGIVDAFAAWRVRITVCATSGIVSSRLQGRGRGRERRHPGRQVPRDPERVEPPRLLGDGAVDREVAGLQPRDVLIARVRARARR